MPTAPFQTLDQANHAFQVAVAAAVAAKTPAAIANQPAAPVSTAPAPAAVPEKAIRQQFLELRGSAREAFLRISSNYAALTCAAPEAKLRDRHYAVMSDLPDDQKSAYFQKHNAPKLSINIP